MDNGEYGRYEEVFPKNTVDSLSRLGLIEKFVPVAEHYWQAALGRRRYVRITPAGTEALKGREKKK